MSAVICPEKDRLFVNLTKMAELCASKRDCDLFECPNKAACSQWWNRVSHYSSRHKLTPEEYSMFIKEFDRVYTPIDRS